VVIVGLGDFVVLVYSCFACFLFRVTYPYLQGVVRVTIVLSEVNSKWVCMKRDKVGCQEKGSGVKGREEINREMGQT
jgi:hypothetical protein